MFHVRALLPPLHGGLWEVMQNECCGCRCIVCIRCLCSPHLLAHCSAAAGGEPGFLFLQPKMQHWQVVFLSDGENEKRKKRRQKYITLENTLGKHTYCIRSAFKRGKFQLSVLFFQTQSMERKLI